MDWLRLFVKFNNWLTLLKWVLPVTCWLTCWCVLPVDSPVNVSFTCWLTWLMLRAGSCSASAFVASMRFSGTNNSLTLCTAPLGTTSYKIRWKPSDILLPAWIMTVGVEWMEQGALLYSQCPLGGWWCSVHIHPQCPCQPSAPPPNYQEPRRPGPLP